MFVCCIVVWCSCVGGWRGTWNDVCTISLPTLYVFVCGHAVRCSCASGQRGRGCRCRGHPGTAAGRKQKVGGDYVRYLIWLPMTYCVWIFSYVIFRLRIKIRSACIFYYVPVWSIVNRMIEGWGDERARSKRHSRTLARFSYWRKVSGSVFSHASLSVCEEVLVWGKKKGADRGTRAWEWFLYLVCYILLPALHVPIHLYAMPDTHYSHVSRGGLFVVFTFVRLDWKLQLLCEHI